MIVLWIGLGLGYVVREQKKRERLAYVNTLVGGLPASVGEDTGRGVLGVALSKKRNEGELVWCCTVRYGFCVQASMILM